ncbi:MAG: cyclic pyranopterin monophosphate synthase MoaC [bacterium]
MAIKKIIQPVKRRSPPPGTVFSERTPDGQARMVNVGAKAPTARAARAEAWVEVGSTLAAKLKKQGAVAKGNVVETARIAGMMAAKQTSSLIPLCHPLVLEVVEVDVTFSGSAVCIRSHVTCEGKTGVEMEALTAVAVAALTVYDMCKSADKGITIGPVRLLEKTGGKSGRWQVT